MSNMVVRTNVPSLNAHRNVKNVGATQARAIQRLSSGFRINNAADDAAGLGISEAMRAQIRGLDQASRNSQDGQALINTAEGGMQEVQNILQRIRELTVQAANDTNNSSDSPQNNVDHIALEIQRLLLEIDSMAFNVEYNGLKLLDGSFLSSENALRFQVGANDGQLMSVTIPSMRFFPVPMVGGGTGTPVVEGSLGYAMGNVSPTGGFLIDFVLAFSYNMGNAAMRSNVLDWLDIGLSFVSDSRAHLGAISNRLDHTMRSLDISGENLSDAESRVRNADMAREMMSFTKSNVLQQAATSMLAQANQLPQMLLQLLR